MSKLKKLSRSQLLELLVKQGEQLDKTKAALEAAQERAAHQERIARLAEKAVSRLAGILEAAQLAQEQYNDALAELKVQMGLTVPGGKASEPKEPPMLPVIPVGMEEPIIQVADAASVFAPASEATAQPIVTPIVESAPEPVVPVAAATAEPVVAPLAEPVFKVVADSVVESVVEPAAEATAEPTEPTTEPTGEPIVKPIPEPVAEPIVEQVAEPTLEPQAKQVAEPASKLAAESFPYAEALFSASAASSKHAHGMHGGRGAHGAHASVAAMVSDEPVSRESLREEVVYERR